MYLYLTGKLKFIETTSTTNVNSSPTIILVSNGHRTKKIKKTILSHKTIQDALADESNNFPKAAIKPKELLIIRVDSVSSLKQNMFWMKHHPSSVV